MQKLITKYKSSGKKHPKAIIVEKKKVGRPIGWRKVAAPQVTVKKKGKVGRPLGWRKNKSSLDKQITNNLLSADAKKMTAEQFKKGLEQEEKKVKDFGESINTFMSRVGGVLHKYYLVGGEKEIRIELNTSKQVRATHNFLGYWEDIPTSFQISFKADSDDVVKRVVIKQQGSDKNLIIMDNPTVIRMNWEEEHTI